MGETFVGIIAQCFAGKWGERKSYTEVVMKLRLAQFMEYLIRAKSSIEWLIFLGGVT
jgi:hypothetical protein